MDDPKSKSQKKREADALQKIGVELISWSQQKLDKLPLSPLLKQAILDAKSIKSHGAIRRQAQLIGKLMRNTNQEELLASYYELQAADSTKTAAFHELEQWRLRLLAEGKPALTEFIHAYPQTDSQQLRQLIKKALDDEQQQKNTGAAKALFRFLRACL